jgi:hypothetical protein
MMAKPRGKYGNTRVKVDHFTFDSQAEARRYNELLLMVRAGEIADLRLQVSMPLIPAFTYNGVKHRASVYRADFVYRRVEDGVLVVEDVKGQDKRTGRMQTTREFDLKWKLLAYLASQNGGNCELRLVTA